jgi:replicative DNA helicase
LNTNTAELEAGLIAAIAASPSLYAGIRGQLPAEAGEAFVAHRSTWLELVDAVEGGRSVGAFVGMGTPTGDPVGAARQLAEAYRRRLLADLTNTALESLSQGQPARAVATELEAGLARLWPTLADRRQGKIAWGDALLDMVAEDVKAAQQARTVGAEAQGLACGIATVDWLLNGWQPGGLYILGGPPGVGKTSLAIQWAYHAASAVGATVIYFTYENSPSNLTLKAVARLAGLPATAAERGRGDPSRWQRGLERYRGVAARLAFVQADAGTSVAFVGARVREALARAPGAPGLVIVDYLQRMAYGERFGTLDENVAALSLRLRDLASQLDVPVLAISSLASSETADDPLHLGALARRGDLEYSADVVLLLGPRTYVGAASNARAKLLPGVLLLDLLIAKNRYGEASRTVPLLFRPATGDFQEEREV